MSEDILSKTPPRADARVAYGADQNQFLDLRFPKDKTHGLWPLIINIHGGFWRAKYSLDHAGHLCAALSARGLVTANLEYRRVGNDGGGWPGTFQDIRSAYHFLVQHSSQHKIDPTRILVMGHSAGGQLALCLAAHEPGVSRTVSLAGVVDLQKTYQLHLSNDAVVAFLRGTPAEVPDHYHEADPMQLSIPHARQWLIHGSADDTVPPEFSRDYVARKSKPPAKEDARLLEIAGADHYDMIDPNSAAWKQIVDVISRLLDDPSSTKH